MRTLHHHRPSIDVPSRGGAESAAARNRAASCTVSARRRDSQGTRSCAGGCSGSMSSRCGTVSTASCGAGVPRSRYADNRAWALAKRLIDRWRIRTIVDLREELSHHAQVRHQPRAVVEQRGDLLDRQAHARRLDTATLQRAAERRQRVVGLATQKSLLDRIAGAHPQRVGRIRLQVGEDVGDHLACTAPLPRRQHVAEAPRQQRAEQVSATRSAIAKPLLPGLTRFDCSSAITLAAVAVSQ